MIELRKDAQPDVILNQLYRMTQLQTSFGVNMTGTGRENTEADGNPGGTSALCESSD